MDNAISSNEGRIFDDVIRSDEGRMFDEVIRSDEGITTNNVHTTEHTEQIPWIGAMTGGLLPAPQYKTITSNIIQEIQATSGCNGNLPDLEDMCIMASLQRMNDWHTRTKTDTTPTTESDLPNDSDGHEKLGEGEIRIPICATAHTTEPLPTEKEPRGHKIAIRDPRWKEAMEREVNQLVDKNAWDLVNRPRDAKVLPGLWQFKIKRDERGKVIKYKARWCVDGSRSPLDISPETKFSPVAEKSTIRLLFATAAHLGVKVMQADFPNAYLNATIQDDVYVVQPRGLEDPNERHKVCKLNKALYGMAMSGKCWHDALS